MEKFFAFTPLSASFKRTVSMVLWSLSILVVLTVIGYFIYQWNSSKNTKEKMKDLSLFDLNGQLYYDLGECNNRMKLIRLKKDALTP